MAVMPQHVLINSRKGKPGKCEPMRDFRVILFCFFKRENESSFDKTAALAELAAAGLATARCVSLMSSSGVFKGSSQRSHALKEGG